MFRRVKDVISTSSPVLRLTQFVQQAQDAVFTYPPQLLAQIRNLQYQKLSLEFKGVGENIIQGIWLGQIKLGKYEFVLSPELLAYFPKGHHSYPVLADEPIIVQRIKKILGILQQFEKLFHEVETLYISPIEPHSLRDQVKLLAVLPRFNQIINMTHGLFKEIFDLGLDAESLFGNESAAWLHELLRLSQALNQPQQQQIEQNMRRLSWDNLSQTMGHQFRSLQEAAIPEQLGKTLGQVIHKMAAGDENFQFLIQLMHDLPLVLQDVRVFIEDKLGVDDLHTSMVELKKLEDRTRASLQGIDYLNGLSLANVLKVVNLIAHIRSILVAVQSYTKTVGDLQHDIQTGIKQKLQDLKFDYLFNFFVILDDLEIQMMLAPGELSQKFSPQIEAMYAKLITYLSDHVQFQPEDKGLVNLFDVQWHNRRLELSYRRQAQVIARQKELRNLARYVSPFVLDLDGEKARFFALKDYLRQVDDAYYNLSLEHLKAGETRPLPQEVGEKILAAIQQDKIQLQFRERRLLASHQYLDDLQNQVLVLLPLERKPSLKQLQQRLWYQSAIVRFGQDSLFYNGHAQSIIPLTTPLEFANSATAYGQLVALSSAEFMNFSQTIRQIIKNPQWMAAYWDEQLNLVDERAILGKEGDGALDLSAADVSLDELALLVDRYQAQVLKFNKAKSLLLDLFNFIMALPQPQPNASLSPENTQVLLTHFLRVGPYLLDGLPSFTSLLAQNRIKIQDLKTRSRGSILELLGIYERHLEMYQERRQQIELKISVQCAEKYLMGFQTLVPLERVGFILRSTRYSSLVQHLREQLCSMQTFYSPAFLAMIEHPEGYCPDLLEAPTRMAQAHQTLDFQLIWNASHFLEQFIVKMESWRHEHLLPTYASVSEKADMVLAFLAAQAYFMPGRIELKQHQQVLTKAYQDMKHVLMLPNAELNQYVLHQNDQGQHASGLEQCFHWILNGDEIFKDMVRPHYTEPDFKARLEYQTQVTMSKIRSILGRSNYLSLVTETFSIYQLMKDVKTRFNRLVTQIYQVNLENLPNLKQELFGPLIQIMDEVEINLGLNPRYFSQVLVECLDVIFEHYLQALQLDPLMFARLMSDPSLTHARIQQWQLRLGDIPVSIEAKLSKQRNIASFVKHLEKEQFGLVTWDPNLPAFQESKAVFLRDVLPVLVEMSPDYSYTLPKEFLSSHQVEVDRLIQAWINVSDFTLETHDYLNMIKYALPFLEGQMKSLGLEQALLRDKQELLSQNLVLQRVRQPEYFGEICQNFYRDALHGILSKTSGAFNHLQADYLSRLKRELPLLDAELSHWRESLQAQFDALPQAADHQDSMQSMIEAAIHARLTPANQNLLKKYQVMDAILTILNDYSLYLNSLPSTQSWLNQPELNVEKAHTLLILKNLIMDSNLNIEERAFRTFQLMQNPRFKQDMQDMGHQHDSWFIRLLVSVWQTVLNLLSYLGVFCQAQKPMLWVRQLDKLAHTFSLFVPPENAAASPLPAPLAMPG